MIFESSDDCGRDMGVTVGFISPLGCCGICKGSECIG